MSDLSMFWAKNRRIILVAAALIIFVVASFVIWQIDDTDIDRAAFGIGAAAIGFLLALVFGDIEVIVDDIEVLLMRAGELIQEYPIGEVLDESQKELIKTLRENSAIDVVELGEYIMRAWADKIDRSD